MDIDSVRAITCSDRWLNPDDRASQIPEQRSDMWGKCNGIFMLPRYFASDNLELFSRMSSS